MVDADEPITGNSQIQALKEQVRELEGIVEELTQRNNFLQEVLAKATKAASRNLPPPPTPWWENPSVEEGFAKAADLFKAKSKPSAS